MPDKNPSQWRTIVPSTVIGILAGISINNYAIVGDVKENRSNLESLRQFENLQRDDFKNYQRSTDERIIKLAETMNAFIGLIREQNVLLKAAIEIKTKP